MQFAQIVPKYRHPHNMTVINDNTEFDDSVSLPEPATVRSFFVIVSDKGRDGEFVSLTDPVQFVREFGTPNMDRHGQPAYNAYTFLKNPEVEAYVLRVTAKNAAFAHTVIAARIKATEAVLDANGEKEEDGKLEVYYQAFNIPSFVDRNQAETAMKLMETNTPDDEGFITIPLFVIFANGKGEYGNSYRTRIVRDFSADGENPFVNYRTEVYELDGTLRQRESVSGSLYFDAVDGGQTYYLGDRFDDENHVNGNAAMTVYEDGITRFHELYEESVQPDEQIPVYEFDFLFGLLKSDEMEPIPGFEFVEHEDAIILDSPNGIQLIGGSDGDFEYIREDDKLLEREEYINQRYIDAFSGKIDRSILSKRRTPSEVFFDANYSEEVKREILNLLLHRYDALGYMDAGIMRNISEALLYSDELYAVGDMIKSNHFQHYQIRDEFSGKRITVTYTYFMASTLPAHIVRRGLETPFAMEDRTLLTGHIKNTLKPIVDTDDVDIKEQLYNNRMNYVEMINDNRFIRGTQSTSLTGTTKQHWSELNEENNVLVLLSIKRDLEDMVAARSYNFAREEDREYFTERARDLIEYKYDDMLHSYDVRFDMNAYEEKRSILHCYLSVSFQPLVKRSIIEIDVNPRS